jgi:MoaA/NifB/PqqE/SkfB family radical SAM enzyme
VIISVDGSKEVHDRIRNIPNGYDKLTTGISDIRSHDSRFSITARCVLQRYNYADFENTVRSAKEIGVDSISFLAADISTSAFNHEKTLNTERIGEIALSREEIVAFEEIIQTSFTTLATEYKSGFIAERPEKMRKIVQYYKALNGTGEFPRTVCNAPWVSAVIESNGDVMPCFFHKPYGNIHQHDFMDIINSDNAVSFRKKLNVAKDDVCRKCVCSLRIGLTQMN